MTMNNANRFLSLSGEWVLGADGVDCIPAHVPSDVLDDLRAAGLIKDPCHRMDYLDCVWCGKKEWVYRKVFTGNFPEGEIHELVFDALSYIAEVSLNGRHLATHRTMMRELRIPVAGILRDGAENELVVKVRAFNEAELDTPVISFWSNWSEGIFDPRLAAKRGAGRKANYSYGWDWTHGLPTCGIWRDVRVESYPVARPARVFADARPDGGIDLSFELHTRLREVIDGTALLSIRRKGGTGGVVFSAEYPLTLGPGVTEYHLAARLESPQLWHPAGHGGQPLYELALEIADGGRRLTEFETSFGFRSFEIEERRYNDSQGLFQFRVNGQPVFANGGNWVPPDMLPGTVTAERLRHLLKLATEAGYNYLRVWGGGYYESDCFYDLCDEAGIMVWQDFMFGGPEVPDFDPAFRAEVRREAEEVVARLRRHPCLCVWCGSNETDEFYLEAKNCKMRRPNGGYYGWTLLHEDIPQIVSRMVPSAVYIPSCPYRGKAAPEGTANNAVGFGTCHAEWLPQFESDEAFDRTVVPTFMNEFYGMCPLPESSARRFLSPEDQGDYNNPVFAAHNMLEVQRNDEWGQIFRHLCFHDRRRRFELPLPELLNGFGICAEELMTRYLALFRRNRKYCGGTAYWQFNSAYPMINCDIVDYYGVPKASWYATRRASVRVAPILAVYDDRIDVYMSNISGKAESGELSAALKSFRGEVISGQRRRVVAAPESSELVLSIPRGGGCDATRAFAWAQWRGDDGQEAQTHRYLCVPRELKLPEAEVEIVRRDRRSVTLRSSAFARRVIISPYDRGCYPSDNFFDLYPGCEKTVLFSAPADGQITVEHENRPGRGPYVCALEKIRNPGDDIWELELYNPGMEASVVPIRVQGDDCEHECPPSVEIPADGTARVTIRLRANLFRRHPIAIPVDIHVGGAVLLETFFRMDFGNVLSHGVLRLQNCWEKPLAIPGVEYRARLADGTELRSAMPPVVLQKGQSAAFDFRVPRDILPDTAVISCGDSQNRIFESKCDFASWWRKMDVRPFDGGDFPVVPLGSPLRGCSIRADDHVHFLRPCPDSRAQLNLFWELGTDVIRMTLYVRGIPFWQPYEGTRVWRATCVELIVGTADRREWRDLSLALTERGPQICLRRTSGTEPGGLLDSRCGRLEVLRSVEDDLTIYRLELFPSGLGMPALSGARAFRFGIAMRYPDANAMQIYNGINYGNGLSRAGLAALPEGCGTTPDAAGGQGIPR